MVVFPWLCLSLHWTRITVSLSLDVSFSSSLSVCLSSLLSHTRTHYRNALTLGDFTYFSASLSSPQTSVLDKRQLKGNLNLKQGPQQKHAAPKWKKLQQTWSQLLRVGGHHTKSKNVILTLLSQPSSVYCKIGSTAEGEGGRDGSA